MHASAQLTRRGPCPAQRWGSKSTVCTPAAAAQLLKHSGQVHAFKRRADRRQCTGLVHVHAGVPSQWLPGMPEVPHAGLTNRWCRPGLFSTTFRRMPDSWALASAGARQAACAKAGSGQIGEVAAEGADCYCMHTVWQA